MPEWDGTDEELEMLDAQGWDTSEEEQYVEETTRRILYAGINGISADDIVGDTVNCEVNHPDHYTAGGIEVMDVIKVKLTREEWIGYLKGNMIKYLLRANFKGQHDKDLGKTGFYAKELVDATTQEET